MKAIHNFFCAVVATIIIVLFTIYIIPLCFFRVNAAKITEDALDPIANWARRGWK